MNLTLTRRADKLIAVFDGDLGKTLSADLTPLLTLGDDLDVLVEPIFDRLRLTRTTTTNSSLQRLRALGETLMHLRVSELPKTEVDWQQLVLDVHRHVLTRTDRSASLKIRYSVEWQTTRSFFIDLIEAESLQSRSTYPSFANSSTHSIYLLIAQNY